MAYEYLDIDLNPFIERLRDFRLLEIYKFNRFLGEIDDYIYDTSDELESLNIEDHNDSEIIIEKLKTLQPQAIELNKLLDKLYRYFDNKYMCRLLDSSIPLEKNIEEKLKNNL